MSMIRHTSQAMTWSSITSGNKPPRIQIEKKPCQQNLLAYPLHWHVHIGRKGDANPERSYSAFTEPGVPVIRGQLQ